MLFERRAYTLRPGSEPSYWALQRQWNKPASFRPLLERNLGYFAMAAGDVGQVTIQFDPSVFASHQTITLDGTDLEISDLAGQLTVAGPAAGVTFSGF